MERKELKKILIKRLNAFCKERGFPHRHGLIWYRIGDGFLLTISLNTKSYGYDLHYNVNPLFDYIDCFHLDYGNEIEIPKIYLSLDYDEETTKEVIEAHLHELDRIAIPIFNSITDAATIYDNTGFMKSRYIDRLKGYAAIYARKSPEDAIHSLETWLEKFDIRDYNDEFHNEPKVLIKLLKEDPEKARDVLVKNVERSVEALKLKI